MESRRWQDGESSARACNDSVWTANDNIGLRIFATLLATAQRFDFDYCAYAIKRVDPEGRMTFAVHDNYPESWRQRYREQGYVAVDPIIHIAMESESPLLWSASAFAAAPGMWRDANACGLRHGWSIPVRNASGDTDALSFVRQQRAISVTELERLQVEVGGLAELAHLGLRSSVERGVTGDLPPQLPEPALSARELEVLRWTAEGKTRKQISDLLNLAERTVKQYAENTLNKLKAENNAHAVMLAVRLGLI